MSTYSEATSYTEEIAWLKGAAHNIATPYGPPLKVSQAAAELAKYCSDQKADEFFLNAGAVADQKQECNYINPFVKEKGGKGKKKVAKQVPVGV
mmetsp:Transcript_55957/g.111060  ORF Transcript_55957/g.111060 Transcript_55957/m.111060 type:complete len:94 (+) Transcript_55957:53-334(+)|eukprot:CAMPEP_0174696294 /NCGR_PEP_ID=MMETSP1094-20130205/2473_1 /TAXON_ID=156173 /ORGANISM="Chrysochromulina brevifilum, Strain UTEX LB 985" /LENGTH=93 /DNA_ID=CAMNT_0015893025 /DNA_START=47 /DNA_END=328 /DNA_ORIENTATION=+